MERSSTLTVASLTPRLHERIDNLSTDGARLRREVIGVGCEERAMICFLERPTAEQLREVRRQPLGAATLGADLVESGEERAKIGASLVSPGTNLLQAGHRPCHWRAVGGRSRGLFDGLRRAGLVALQGLEELVL